MDGLAKRALLAQFDAEMRRDPPAEAGFRYECPHGVLRAIGPYAWIPWWDFDAARADEIVAREVGAFAAAHIEVEWKIYGHDEPADLDGTLARHGFVADEAETLMVLDLGDLGSGASATLAAGFTLRRVEDEPRLRDFIRATEEAFGSAAPWMITALPPQLFGVDAWTTAYAVYYGDRPVGVGRIECPPGRSFASLWGGGTIAEYRHQGVFRSIVATRIACALRTGHRYLTVEARDTSRPILERLGFLPPTRVVGWKRTIDPD